MSEILVTDTIAHALMQLVDDSNNGGVYREPSHADIEFHVNQAGLGGLDPKQQGQLIEKPSAFVPFSTQPWTRTRQPQAGLH